MESEARYTLIGGVLIGLIVSSIAFFLWLGSSGRATDFRYYTIYFERQSLEGLQIGGDVNMRGVRVGRVENYALSRENINRVGVKIRVARETPVSENTTAVVARNVLTGIARINLNTPGTPGPELVKVPKGESHPVIAEGTSDLDQIADAVSRLAVQADTALDNVIRVMGPRNQRSISEALTAIRDLAVALNQRVDLADDATQALRTSADALGRSSLSIAQSVERIAQSVEPLGTRAGDALVEAQTALRTLGRSTQNLEQSLLATSQRMEAETLQLARRSEDTLEVGLYELRETSAALRSAAERIAHALDRLQDPRAALLGPGETQLGPGEGRR